MEIHYGLKGLYMIDWISRAIVFVEGRQAALLGDGYIEDGLTKEQLFRHIIV